MLTPRHNRMMRPVTANETRKRVLVRRTKTARHGGRRDLADFQLTPPFGNNMMDVRGEMEGGGFLGGGILRSLDGVGVGVDAGGSVVAGRTE